MNKPEFNLERYPHGWLVKPAEGEYGVPMDALSQVAAIMPPGAIVHAGIANALGGEIWTTGDKRQILPKDMELRHLANVMRTLENRVKAMVTVKAAELTPEQTIELLKKEYPIYGALAAELGRRMRGESSEPEQRTSRKFNLE